MWGGDASLELYDDSSAKVLGVAAVECGGTRGGKGPSGAVLSAANWLFGGFGGCVPIPPSSEANLLGVLHVLGGCCIEALV